MSYTTFEQKITSFDTSNEKISVTVEVKNIGRKAGKEVVQIYYNPPYTELDKTMKIEKPTATLAGFAKTKIIEPGATDSVTVTFDREEMASYCYTRDNGDGTKGCYMLEEGDYAITLRKNSHDIIETKTWYNNGTVWFDAKNPSVKTMAMAAAVLSHALVRRVMRSILFLRGAHNENPITALASSASGSPDGMAASSFRSLRSSSRDVSALKYRSISSYVSFCIVKVGFSYCFSGSCHNYSHIGWSCTVFFCDILETPFVSVSSE